MEERDGIQWRLIIFNFLILFLMLTLFLVVYCRDRQMLKPSRKQPLPVQTNRESPPITLPAGISVPATIEPKEQIPPAEDNGDFDGYRKERLQQKKNDGTPME